MTDSSTAGADTGVVEVSGVSQAESPPANEGVKSYEDAIDAALGSTEESPASASGDEATTSKPTGETVKAGEEGENGSGDPQDPTEDELKSYSHTAQSRIRELVDRRKAAESQITERDQQIEELRPRAERIDKLESFMRANSVSHQDLDNAVNISALIQTGRYDQALQLMGPIYQELLDRTGNILPQELQQEVEAGYITRQRALELHKSRKSSENATAREKAATERDQRESAERAHANRVDMMTRAGDAWASEKKTSDPDWSTKQDLVNSELELQLRRIAQSTPQDLPRDIAGVRKLLDGCLKTVEGRLKVFRPAPQAITPTTGRPAGAGAQSKPATYMDAINQALGE